VPESSLADRLGDLIDLTAEERTALSRLDQRERPLRRGGVLLRENDKMTELYVLRSGVMMSYVLLHDGSRQILRFLFPGDLLATAALAYHKSPETLVALTDAVVAPFDRAEIATLIGAHPRLAGLLIVTSQMDRVALTDRLAALGRTSAKSRVASLLLEIRNRMRAIDKSVGATFTLGLTQEEIGDATGLTAVHVNRMLRRLEEEGMITRQGGRVTFVDEAAIGPATNYVDRVDGLDLNWLPAAR